MQKTKQFMPLFNVKRKIYENLISFIIQLVSVINNFLAVWWMNLPVHKKLFL